MLDFFSLTSKVGAVALSIGAALFWIVYKGWFENDIFSKMTPEQTFQAFIWTTSGAFVLVVISFVVHLAKQKNSSKSITATRNSNAIDNSGTNNSVRIEK